MRQIRGKLEPVLCGEFLLESVGPREDAVHGGFIHERSVEQLVECLLTIPPQIFPVRGLKEKPCHFRFHQIGIMPPGRETADLDGNDFTVVFRLPVEGKTPCVPDGAPVRHVDFVFKGIGAVPESALNALRFEGAAIFCDIENIFSAYRETPVYACRRFKDLADMFSFPRVKLREFEVLCSEFGMFPYDPVSRHG